MANIFDNLLGSLSSKFRSFSSSAKEVISKSAEERDAITDKVKSLTSSLSTFNNISRGPTTEAVSSIIKKKTESQALIDKKSSLMDATISAPGTPFKSTTPFDKAKSEAQEFFRSGKVDSEIDEMKKEWLMEESKVRWSEANPWLTYEEAVINPDFSDRFAKAEEKWSQLWESDKEALVPSLKTISEQSLIQQSEHKEDWIKDQISFFEDNKKAKNMMSLNDMQTHFPDWFAQKEEEYYQTQEVSAYMGLAIKTFDQDLVGLLGKDKMADMETKSALLGGGDPKTMLTAMSLDIIDFNDIANVGQDVYVKDDKIYYRGFEIDDKYLSDEGKQMAMVTDLVARFTGAMPTYGVISGLIKKGVFTLARAKDVPSIFAGGQKLLQGVDWAAKNAPFLTEITAFNTFEEITEAAIRKGTGQEYTFGNFIAGLAMGAGMAGTLTVLGKSVDTVELKGLVRDMEANVKDSGNIQSLRPVEFQGRSLEGLYLETRHVYYKGLNKPNIRPGVDVSAPIPKQQELDLTEAKEGGKPGDDMNKVSSKQLVSDESFIPKEGQPFEFSYVRNTEKAPQVGTRFGQDVEPAGKYMTVGSTESVKNIPNMETGNMRFDNPLVVDFGGGYGATNNWKNVLSKRFDGKTGAELSNAIQDAGYDGIITISKTGGKNYTSEIVALSPKTVDAGELKTRGLSQSVEAKAVEKSLTTGFDNLPKYMTVSMKDQAEKATKLIKSNYGEAKDIAMGKKAPPEGVFPESLYVAVEKKALADGDVKTLKELATTSRLNEDVTEMGQRIRTLGERDPYSPVAKMKDLINVRETVAKKKRGGQSPVKIKKQIRAEIQQQIVKVKIKKNTWAALIEELTC